MNNNEKILEKNDIQKKSYHRKYITAIVLIVLFILWVVSYNVFMSSKSLPDNDVIRSKASIQLNKSEKQFTSNDFKKIIKLDLSGSKLSNINLLKRFNNLRELNLNNIQFSKAAVPRWKKYLAKYGLLDLLKEQSFDISPIKNLTSLQVLNLSHTHSLVNNINSLSKLTMLTDLNLEFTQVSNLEPIRNIKSLQILNICTTPVTDLIPIKGLTNLKTLDIMGCEKITDEQVRDLQNSLPNLRIYYREPSRRYGTRN